MYAQKSRINQIIWGAITGLILGKLLIIPVALFFTIPQWPVFFIMGLFLLLLCVPFMIASASDAFDPFEPVYLWIAMYGYLYLAKPVVQLMSDIPFQYGGEYLGQSIWIAILGLFFFYVGYYGSWGRHIAGYLPVTPKELSSKKLQIIGWIFIMIGFWGLNKYIQTSGGWLEFWSKPHGLGGKATITTAYLYQLPELMVVGFILIFETVLHYARITWKHIIMLLVAALGGVGIYTIIWGSRTNFSWIFLACFLLFYLAKSRRPSWKTVVTTLAIIVVALGTIPIYRSYVHFGGDIKNIKNSVDVSNIFRTIFNPSDEFNIYLAEVALVPENVGYDYFFLQRSLLLHPIPRLIWPKSWGEKPPVFNRHWDEFLAKSGSQWGAAETMLGDFWAELGFWGVIIGTFISGILWKIIYAYLKNNKNRRGTMLIYAVALPNMLTYLAQGSAIAVLKWLPYMMPGTILAVFLSRKRPQ